MNGNTMHQLHHQSSDGLVARLHTAMLAMRRSVCDSSQAKQADAGAASSVSDAQREADAGGNTCTDKTTSSPTNTGASSS